MKKYVWLFSLLIITTLTNPKISLSENLQSKCRELTKIEIKKIISYINLKKFSIADLGECQTKSYKLFIELIKIDENNIEYAHKSIKSNRTFILDFANKYPKILSSIDLDLKSDPVFFNKLVKIYNSSLKYASYSLINDRAFMKRMIDINPHNYIYASDRLQNNKDFTLYSVKKDGRILRYSSLKMRSDFEVVENAIKSYSIAIGYASKKLRENIKLKELVKKYNYSFLYEINSFLKENYAGVGVGPYGIRGYRIVNQAKFLKDIPIISRKNLFQQRTSRKLDNKLDYQLVPGKLKNISWKYDLRKYPNLIKSIYKSLKGKLDKNTIDSLVLTSSWKVSSRNSNIIAFKLYSLKNIKSIYNKKNVNNTSSFTGIAYQEVKVKDKISILKQKDRVSGLFNIANKKLNKIVKKNQEEDTEWSITVVDQILDNNLENNILLTNNHQDYEFWDIIEDKNSNISNLLFRIKEENSEFFKIFSKQENNIYKPIYTGGGYSFN